MAEDELGIPQIGRVPPPNDNGDDDLTDDDWDGDYDEDGPGQDL